MLWLLIISGVFPSLAVRLPPDSTQETLVPLTFCGSTRTLADIIWSCLATVLACGWVAIHPNVPKSPQDWWKTVRGRAMIMFCALVAPEFIIWWALRQWKGAKAIQRQFELYADRGTWTITHAHFLQMGGFLLCSHDKEPLEVLVRPTFTHLLETNQISFPNITEQEILDKSKGDGFSKSVASIQTFWFVLQIIARAAQQLPVSVLEIVTLGYAVLNCAVYFLWWSKPLNVACPISLCLKPEAEYYQYLKEKNARAKQLPEIPSDLTEAKVESTDAPGSPLEAQSAESPTNLLSRIFGRIPLPLQIILALILVVLVPALALAVLGMCLALAVVAIAAALAVAIPFLIFAFIILAIGYATRAPLVLTVYRAGHEIFSHITEPCASYAPMHSVHQPNQVHTSSFAADEFSDSLSRDRNRSPEDTQGGSTGEPNAVHDNILLLTCGALTVTFGAMHCIAWSFYFPTSGERTLWRVCALLVTCIPLVYMIESMIRAVRKRPALQLSQRGYAELGLVLLWNVYAVARLMLLILAVIGLRNMPLQMFLAVKWVDFLPHF